MAEHEGSTPAPHLALVIDHPSKQQESRQWTEPAAAAASEYRRSTREFLQGCADEIIEAVIGQLSLLEAFGYLSHDVVIDPHAVSAAASNLVSQLRTAQKRLRGEL